MQWNKLCNSSVWEVAHSRQNRCASCYVYNYDVIVIIACACDPL